jgi:MFS family permease
VGNRAGGCGSRTRHGGDRERFGKARRNRGRKPLLITAFAFLALRNGLTVVSHNPWYLISLQALDGVAAGIYGVLLTLITADLARGTGRFNFLQGIRQSGASPALLSIWRR